MMKIPKTEIPKDPIYVYVVGFHDVEECIIQGVYASYDSAFKTWDAIRLELIEREHDIYRDTPDDPTYQRCILALSETDPKRMNNWPLYEPFMWRYELHD